MIGEWSHDIGFVVYFLEIKYKYRYKRKRDHVNFMKVKNVLTPKNKINRMKSQNIEI